MQVRNGAFVGISALLLIAGASYFAYNYINPNEGDLAAVGETLGQNTVSDTNQNGEEVTLLMREGKIGTSASAFAVTVVPLEVLEDSRCPSDVQCIQAGTVRLRAQLISASGQSTMVFALGVPVTTEAEEITLTDVVPAPKAGVRISPEEYRFIFKIEKRDLYKG